jgi:enamine deaminase RidA (YjgF/YER057c/UK114 family)
MVAEERAPESPRDELDAWLEGFDALLARIKGSVHDRVQVHVHVEEEIRESISHVLDAMEAVVEWMQQGHSLHPGAMVLLQQLKSGYDVLVQCIGGCPVEMIEMAAFC